MGKSNPDLASYGGNTLDLPIWRRKNEDGKQLSILTMDDFLWAARINNPSKHRTKIEEAQELASRRDAREKGIQILGRM